MYSTAVFIDAKSETCLGLMRSAYSSSRRKTVL